MPEITTQQQPEQDQPAPQGTEVQERWTELPIPVDILYLIEDIEKEKELGVEACLHYWRWSRRRATVLDRKVQVETGGS